MHDLPTCIQAAQGDASHHCDGAATATSTQKASASSPSPPSALDTGVHRPRSVRLDDVMSSQPRIQSVIDIGAKAFRIKARNVPPPIEQRRRIERPSRRRSQLGDHLPRTRHGETLTGLHPVHDAVRILPKLPNRNPVHMPNVLPGMRTAAADAVLDVNSHPAGCRTTRPDTGCGRQPSRSGLRTGSQRSHSPAVPPPALGIGRRAVVPRARCSSASYANRTPRPAKAAWRGSE